ncbi:hypothetical protein [Geotalea toluenoxydans]|uniref:hypothetical protein n=1 Tax=Geotalea toluenoxydans TaxID=421624 RepID=UPI003F700B61
MPPVPPFAGNDKDLQIVILYIVDESEYRQPLHYVFGINGQGKKTGDRKNFTHFSFFTEIERKHRYIAGLRIVFDLQQNPPAVFGIGGDIQQYAKRLTG